VRLYSANPGFESKDLLTMRVSLRKYAQPAQRTAFYKAVIQRIDVLPGVTAAAISTALPTPPTHQTPVLLEGHPAVELGRLPMPLRSAQKNSAFAWHLGRRRPTSAPGDRKV
jgi:hypothetical protein